ncbi:MAG: (Fe-S)-binding protein [Actinobacteria bacterium]|nr:(Fe-S)-binding protein [Actinomycetota bacterium]
MANYVCPVARYTKLETNTPRGLAFIYSLVAGNLKKIDKVAVERTYQCNLCRACEAISRDDSSIPELILAARRDIVEMNMAPESVMKLKDDICKNSRLLDKDWLESAVSSAKSLPDTVVVINYESESSKKIFLLIKKLLDRGNTGCIEINIGKHPAPAAMLDELGYKQLSGTVLNNLTFLIQNLKFKKMVFITPYDLELLLKTSTVDAGLSKLVHSFEFCEGFINSEKKTPAKKNEKIIYIDSGGNRKSGKFYEIPRKLLADSAGLNIQEMVWNGKESACCGGLTLQYLYPGIFNGVISLIYGELKEYGSKKIITPCPHCIDNLKTNEDLRNNYEIVDLWEMIFQ